MPRARKNLSQHEGEGTLGMIRGERVINQMTRGYAITLYTRVIYTIPYRYTRRGPMTKRLPRALRYAARAALCIHVQDAGPRI